MNQMMTNFRRNFRLKIVTLVVLTASICVINGILSVGYNLKKILTLWGESQQLSVYLSENVKDDESSAIENYLKENTNVDQYKFVNKQDAVLQFRDQIASYAPDLLNDADLMKFIPSSFQVGINKKIAAVDQLSTMQDLATALKVQPGVEEVSYGQEWVKTYSTFVSGLEWTGSLFILVVLISGGFVMANSIQSSVEARRFEIEVLELIGATTKFIRRPFILEGALISGLSSILALSISYGFFQALKNSFRDQISILQLSGHLHFLSPGLAIFVFMLSVGFGGLVAWLCVKRINTGWAAGHRRQSTENFG